MAAIPKVNKRFNLLSLLPPEIQLTVFNFLTFRERLQCTAVSKEWRSMILNGQDMWHTLSTDDGHVIVPELLPYQSYMDPSSIKRVVYNVFDDAYRTPKQYWPGVVDFLINQKKCNAIEEVELCTRYMMMEYISPLLTACGDTLTRLLIAPAGFHGAYSTENITPDLFFRHCPNLTSFTFAYQPSSSSSFIKNWKPRLPSQPNKHLVDLALTTFNYKLDPEPFLQVAPNLKHLALFHLDESISAESFASMLSRYCPKLASLALTELYGRAMFGITTVVHRRSERQQQQQRLLRRGRERREQNDKDKGIIELLLYDQAGSSQSTQSLLYHFAEQQHEKLRYVYLSGMSLARAAMSRLSQHVYPSLTHLSLQFETYDGRSMPMSMVNNFLTHSVPNLESLYFEDSFNAQEENNDTLSALANLKRLQELTIDYGFNVTTEQLLCFFKTIAQNQHCNHDNTSCCTRHPMSSPSSCSSCRALPALRIIEFKYAFNAVNSQVLDAISRYRIMIDELTLVDLSVSVNDLSVFLDTLIAAAPICSRRKNEWRINRFYFHYSAFYSMSSEPVDIDVQCKEVLAKLDGVAKEWSFYYTHIIAMTHEEYRLQQKEKQWTS
ncbi:hypothetical protein BDB00DRAFT_31088 [Zychaea mexicana]|uniref:uncharacterized protein n=1 Tax=Zychaea mexicana TaxID=64656 RepID=UPI0022FED922|nr:uncharacterized protein BDB00DRAFT_31088 [Zychaea mexicana]KAI9488685.1 hypothetical protein BDB00DRAFT_31088 [Zychaea mexicana]